MKRGGLPEPFPPDLSSETLPRGCDHQIARTVANHGKRDLRGLPASRFASAALRLRSESGLAKSETELAESSSEVGVSITANREPAARSSVTPDEPK